MNTSSTLAGPSALRGAGLFALLILIAFTPACDSSPTGEDNGHSDGDRVEVRASGTLLGVWTGETGWESVDGAPLSELPDPVASGGTLSPLVAGGMPAELVVRVFEDGEALEMTTVSEDQQTGERTCSEYSVRYYPTDDATTRLAWPNIRHPNSADGEDQFARRADEELVHLFRCDHVRVYPETEGTVEVEFHLWHLNHSDVSTDPIRLRVAAP